MAKFDFVYDEKIKVWVRRNVSVEADTEEQALDILKRHPNLYNVDDLVEFQDDEVLYETEQGILPEENNENSTIEIYIGDTQKENLVYRNGK